MEVANYVIAGGTKGIGRDLADRLLQDGGRLVILSREPVADWHPDVTQHQVDFSDPNATIPPAWIPASLRGVAYCPGSINLRSFRSLKPEDFRRDFEVNVIGAVKFLQACAAGLKLGSSQSTSSVVLFSSVAAQRGMGMHASIASSKSAIEGMTRSLAAEWSPGIRVNCVAPALIETTLSQRFLDRPERRQQMDESYPLKRIGQTGDVAELSRFLLTDRSGWMTGQVLGVDGGLSTI
ncbi:SDR family oxidoreductase [Mariniblastus sp.]|nr:SDR family oxidoreductase [Mariniblastus sp.]MDB4756590.1 SDR family oxidoreductase [Mariniblastus sp.]